MIIRLFPLIVFFLLLRKESNCQIGSESMPVSWNLSEDFSQNVVWEELSPIHTEELLAEDAASADKSLPYRFAVAEAVHFDPLTSGQWKNLPNGDRIWKLGIRCENALSMAISLGNFVVPRGAKLYIYNGDQTDYVGPLTDQNNRNNKVLGTLPIRTSEIVIEYYEPFAFRGKGKFFISSVAKSYRDLELYPSAVDTPCLNLLDADDTHRNAGNPSSSVLMMLTDNGQRMATAVMINNAKFDGTLYALTSKEALMGDPDAFVFVVDLSIGVCGSVSACWNKALSGADIVKADASTGIALLHLNGRPRSQWNTYLSGWDISDQEPGDFFSLSHCLTRPQSIALYTGAPVATEWNDKQTVNCDQWVSGGIFQGAAGSPLFNSNGQIIGIYVGGNGMCDDNANDYFALLSKAWNSFRPFLDPFESFSFKLQGSATEFGTGDGITETEKIILYPNPADRWLSVQNNSEDPVLQIILYDHTGRIIYVTSEIFPAIDLGGFAPGHYFVRINQESGFVLKQLILQ